MLVLVLGEVLGQELPHRVDPGTSTRPPPALPPREIPPARFVLSQAEPRTVTLGVVYEPTRPNPQPTALIHKHTGHATSNPSNPNPRVGRSGLARRGGGRDGEPVELHAPRWRLPGVPRHHRLRRRSTARDGPGPPRRASYPLRRPRHAGRDGQLHVQRR